MHGLRGTEFCSIGFGCYVLGRLSADFEPIFDSSFECAVVLEFSRGLAALREPEWAFLEVLQLRGSQYRYSRGLGASREPFEGARIGISRGLAASREP